jgi:hypothetical protein
VKAVQELSEQNGRLQAQLSELAELVYSLQEKDANPALQKSRSSAEPASELQDAAGSGASLQQNSPNPFSQTTVIRYALPQTGSAAQLVVSSAAGQVVRQLPLQLGTDSVTIEGGALAAGVYYVLSLRRQQFGRYKNNGANEVKEMCNEKVSIHTV